MMTRRFESFPLPLYLQPQTKSMNTSKLCNGCKKNKPLEDFNKHKNGKPMWVCRSCQKIYMRKKYLERKSQGKTGVSRLNREQVIDRNKKLVARVLTENLCVDCGERRTFLLEFDHVRGVKRGNISRMVRSAYSEKAILLEIDKCEVRCVRCHRIASILRMTRKDPNTYTDLDRRRLTNREYKQKYLANKSCILCSESDYRVLDFHHKDPSTKKIDIGSMISNPRYKPEEIALEVSKCVILCVTCHRIHHRLSL